LPAPKKKQKNQTGGGENLTLEKENAFLINQKKL
jgi:hypothetical protein